MENKASQNHVKHRFFTKECMLIYDFYTLDILEVNSACLDKYGYSEEEFLSKKITELGEKFRPENNRHNLSGNGTEDLSMPAIWKHYRKDGSSFYVQFTTHQINLNGKNVQLTVLHDITDKIPALSKSLHELPRIDTLKERLPLATLEWDPKANVRDWSPKAEKIFDRKIETVLGQTLYELSILPGSMKTFINDKINELAKSHYSYFTFDVQTVIDSDNVVHTSWHNSANYDQRGNLISIYSLVEDITDRKIAENKLKESEQRFRVLSEASTVGVYLIQDRKLRYVNPRFCEISGYSKEELLDQLDPLQLIHEDDLNKLQSLRDRFQNAEIDSFEVDAKGLSKDETLVHVKIYGSKIMLNDRHAIMGVVIDQTKQVEAQQNYKNSIKSYKTLFDSIGDAIYIHDQKGRFKEVNQAALEMFGYEKKDILGNGTMFISAPGKVDEVRANELIEKALKGEKQRFNWWGRRKNGEVFPMEVTLNPGIYFGANVVIAVVRDISSKYRKEKDLKQNEELFRQLFQNAPVGITMLDRHNEVQRVNKSFEEIFGYTEEEITGLDIDSIIVPDDQMEEARKLSNSTESFEVARQRKTKEGNLVDLLIYGVPVIVDGNTIAIYGIYVDITDRNRAEKKLKNSLKEKEVLLAEIHHRVKNNLAVITGMLELQTHNTKNEHAQQALKDSQMRINTMALIHEKLYQNETLSIINFANYITELVEVIERTHHSGDHPVNINLDLDPIEFTITQAIPCGLLLNEIFTNSYKHAFNQPFDGQATIQAALKLGEDRKVVLSIRDNGLGLPGEFGSLGKQSLGLTLIKTLSKQLGADMTVKSEEGTSYHFSFELEQ